MSLRNAPTPKQKTHILIPATLGLVFAIICALILLTKPQAKRGAPPPEHAIVVEIEKVEPKNITPHIASYGRASPLTRTNLTARVNGVVEYVADTARMGARFSKGDVLIKIEQVDYQIEKRVANAQVAEAESVLANELALGEEAKHNWKASGRSGEPPPLALREPQRRAAEAALESAKANAQRAELNLARTTISAPYDGYVLSRFADIGAYVTINTPLIEVFSSEAAEIALPLKTIDLPLLPLHLINNPAAPLDFGLVKLTSTTDPNVHWFGKIVRGSNAIDNQSRQLHVVARVESPFETTDARSGLKVDEYLIASIQGAPMKGVIVVPNKAIYQNSYVYIYKNKQIFQREITLGWRDNEKSIVTSGLAIGDNIVLTPLGQIPSGTLATIKGIPEEQPTKQRPAATEANP